MKAGLPNHYQSIPYILDRDTIIQDYCSRGIVVLAPEALGIPESIHTQIYDSQKRLFLEKEHMTATTIPKILEIIDAPGVVAACDWLIGKNWAIVPFTHNSPFMSGSNDQHWHKDDNGPFNSRKHRHHQAIQLEMLYYPQAVKQDMGPTATVPYSQYWTFNHEENHDNFAGADHLDFGYQINGMERIAVSGPRSKYSIEDVRNKNTDHDLQCGCRGKFKLPSKHPFEVGPWMLVACCIRIIAHQAIIDRRLNTWRDSPRFMWRLWLYRRQNPTSS